MIKKLQLRGLSRTPSDKITADGGCDESINVQFDGVETAPMLSPENIGQDYDIPSAGLPGPIVFIHKNKDYENIIFHDGDYLKATTAGTQENYMTVCHLNTGETFKGITSVGNTLIISTDQRIEYVLYKYNESAGAMTYHDLGDRIPVPAVQFKTEFVYPTDDAGLFPTERAKITDKKVGATSLKSWNESLWDAYLTHKISQADYDRMYESYANYIEEHYSDYGLSGTAKDLILQSISDRRSEPDVEYALINQTIWERAQVLIRELKKEKYYANPIMVRYALKLYDGSYIYQSVPILLGAGIDDFMHVWGEREDASSSFNSYINVQMRQAYKAEAFYNGDYTEYDNWKDIVESIDIFTSTDIHWPLANAPVTGVRRQSAGSLLYDLSFDYMEGGVIDHDVNTEKQKDEVLSKSEFYLMKSIPFGKFAQLNTDGYRLLFDEKFASEDFLVTQKRLPDDYQSHHRKYAERFFKYNNKVFMLAPKSELSPGYMFLNACDLDKGYTFFGAKISLEFTFFLVDGDGNQYTVRGESAGGHLFESYSGTYDNNGTTVTYYAVPEGWLAYPDSRCKKVEVKYIVEIEPSIVGYMEYEMTPHPFLNCSYVFLGLGQGHVMGAYPGTVKDSLTTTENKIIEEKNIFWASELNNPFVFPLAGRMSFSSDVRALATTTRPLSQGQFGQFPIMVFTGDGVWAVPVTQTGELAACVPISRDVLLNPHSVAGIEQAVVFITKQGVMMLQDGNVVPLSEYMMGGHYYCPTALAQIIQTSSKLYQISTLSDSTTFQDFMNSCEIAYDYAGKRLIFINRSRRYSYVYMLNSKTWHKISIFLGSGTTNPPWIENVLNSYPDCWLCVKQRKAGGSVPPQYGYKLFDFSVAYKEVAPSAQPQGTLKGVIVTRPFDMEEPDVRKVIKDLRIRGKLHRKSVQYILLGSMDGFSWKRLTSLRGGSYRMFRLALIVDMGAKERLSWIDIDYLRKYANKLR